MMMCCKLIAVCLVLTVHGASDASEGKWQELSDEEGIFYYYVGKKFHVFTRSKDIRNRKDNIPMPTYKDQLLINYLEKGWNMTFNLDAQGPLERRYFSEYESEEEATWEHPHEDGERIRQELIKAEMRSDTDDKPVRIMNFVTPAQKAEMDKKRKIDFKKHLRKVHRPTDPVVETPKPVGTCTNAFDKFGANKRSSTKTPAEEAPQDKEVTADEIRATLAFLNDKQSSTSAQRQVERLNIVQRLDTETAQSLGWNPHWFKNVKKWGKQKCACLETKLQHLLEKMES